MAIAVIFGAWGPVACDAPGPNPPEGIAPCDPRPDTDVCTASNRIRAKHNLENRLVWKWADGTIVAFDVADHRSWISWSYNLDTRNIRWIDKSGQGRCLIPIGSCSIEYGIWRLEVCDRSGPDTCLFRREADAKVSFTYGIAFNRHLISCLATRVNWDGTHVRSTHGSSCGSASATGVAKVQNRELVIGEGKNAVRVGRFLSRAQLNSLDRACISENATPTECRKAALRLYRSLPPEVRRKVAPKACAALSPDAWQDLDPRSPCARRAVP